MRRCTNGDETDVHSPYRHRHASYRRAGATARVKRRTRRRERQEGKGEVATQWFEHAARPA